MITTSRVGIEMQIALLYELLKDYRAEKEQAKKDRKDGFERAGEAAYQRRITAEGQVDSWAEDMLAELESEKQYMLEEKYIEIEDIKEQEMIEVDMKWQEEEERIDAEIQKVVVRLENYESKLAELED